MAGLLDKTAQFCDTRPERLQQDSVHPLLLKQGTKYQSAGVIVKRGCLEVFSRQPPFQGENYHNFRHPIFSNIRQCC